MQTLFLLLILNAILLSVLGRNVVGNQQDRGVFEWPLNQLHRASFPDEDSWSAERSYDADDYLENDGEDFYGNLLSADETSDESFEKDTDDAFGIFDKSDDTEYEEYSLMGCSGGKCEICFKIWKLRGCFVLRLTSDGIDIEINAFGKRLFSRKVKVNGSFTLKIKRDKLPKWLRRLMRSDIEIKVSSVDLARKRICVQVKAKVKYAGTLRWPRHSPRCITL